MTKKKPAVLTVVDFWQGFNSYPDDMVLGLELLSGIFGRSAETLVKHATRGLPPPLRDFTKERGPNKHGGPTYGAWLKDIRDPIREAFESGAPSIAQPQPGDNGPASGQPPLAQRDAQDADHRFAKAANTSMGGRRTPRKVAKAATFSKFLETAWIPDDGSDGDEWLFQLVGPHRRPVDVFGALANAVETESGALVPPEDPEGDVFVWMTLDEYLVNVRRAAEEVPRAARADDRRAALAARPATPSAAGDDGRVRPRS